MKKIFLILLLSITFFSCSKEKNDTGKTDSGSIEYKVNGSLITMSNSNIQNGEGVAFAKQLIGIVPETRYLLNAQKGINNVVILTIVTDSLLTTSYHFDSTYNDAHSGSFLVTLQASGKKSMLYFDGDYLDVNISSYSKAHISGTFNGKLTPVNGGLDYNSKGSVIITEGKLKNIPVIY